MSVMPNESSDVILMLTNAPDAAVADRIATALVEARLAACVNVGAPVRSIYRWQGNVEQACEVPLWIKTTIGRREQALQCLHDLHPYDVPEILVLPINHGLPAYLDWVRQETEN